MKQILIVLAVSALVSACGKNAQPGSALAARSAAADVVAMYMAKSVEVDSESVKGDRAAVATEFDGGKCKVDLVRGTSKYGWIVEKVACDDPT